jgi:hypothetical protein
MTCPTRKNTEQVCMSIMELLTLLGLFANLTTLIISAMKYKILENLLLIHWKASTAALILTMLGFLVWFSEEIMELIFYSTYPGLFAQTFTGTISLLLVSSQMLFVYTFVKGGKTVVLAC